MYNGLFGSGSVKTVSLTAHQKTATRVHGPRLSDHDRTSGTRTRRSRQARLHQPRPRASAAGRAPVLPEARDVSAMRAASHQVLDAAYAAGIRWVDVARSYGRAEEFLGEWLRDRGHADVTVSSKWGYAYVGEWRMDAEVHEAKEHSAQRFLRQWRESRDQLDGRISLYQVHSLTVDSPLFADRTLLAELAAVAADGVRIGFSSSGPAQAATIDKALNLDVAGRRLFTAVQSTWNLLEESAGPALRQAHDEGDLVLLKETLANGRLAVDPPVAVADIARSRELGPDAIAVDAARSLPWADIVLIGPSSPGQLADNLAGGGIALTETEQRTLGAIVESPEAYWRQRSALPWS